MAALTASRARDADRERAVVLHQHGARPMAAQRVDDSAADRVVADDGERSDRDRAAELVGHPGDHAGHLLAARGPRDRVGGVRVHDSADLGHLAVDVCVGGGIARGAAVASGRAGDDGAVEGAQHHVVGSQVVVGDTGRLDHEVVGAGNAAGDVAARPDHQAVAHEFARGVAATSARVRAIAASASMAKLPVVKCDRSHSRRHYSA